MSCIAVNILETKREIKRVDLIAPVVSVGTGKFTAVEFKDLDTHKKVYEMVCSRQGLYKITLLILGANLNDFSWPILDGKNNERFLAASKEKKITLSDKIYHTYQLVYAPCDNTRYRLSDEIAIRDNRMINHFHIVIEALF